MLDRWSPGARTLAAMPALVLALLSCWSGTFQAPLAPWAVVLGHLGLCGLAALAGRGWRDPLGLGHIGWWILALLGVWLAVGVAVSPVPRAGRLSLILVPVFCLVPPAIARCWRGSAERRLGVWLVAWVVAAVACRALVDKLALGAERAAMPLGQHNLLALWLVALLPVVGAGLVARRGRLVALGAATLGLVALLATESLAGLVGLAVAAAWATLRLVRRATARRWALLVALVVVAMVFAAQRSRLVAIAGGDDPSFNARLGYWEAGWSGLVERPWLGWGAGSTAWTIDRFIVPRPGIHPPHDVVADLHNFPLQLAYELGLPGLMLVVWMVGALLVGGISSVDGSDERGGGDSRRLAMAGEAGLLGALVAGLGGLPFAVNALPLALTINLAAIRIGRRGDEPADDDLPNPWDRWPPRLVALSAVLFLLPVDLAQLAYGRAAQGGATAEGAVVGRTAIVGAESSASVAGEERMRVGERRAALLQATALDPAFPLYRARLAWLETEAAEDDVQTRRWSALRARRAAEDAGAVAPLWLMAGVLAQDVGEPWARQALLEACRLDPLGAMAPYRLALHGEREPLAELWAARALLAEPRLLAAEELRRRPALLRAAADRARLTEGVDRGWRAVFARHADEALAYGRRHGGGQRVSLRRLVLTLDQDPAQSPSLYTFRRQSWPTRLVSVALHTELVESLELQAATRLGTTDPRLFDDPLCGLKEIDRRP